MATQRALLVAPLWRRSVAEWALLGLVVACLMGVWGYQLRVLQIQAERAAVQATLGNLRTALVLSHIAAHRGAVSGAQARARSTPGANPFALLQTIPANYAGEVALAQADRMQPGTWAFDADCACIGYRLLYPRGLESPPDVQAIWFRVEGLAGPLQIKGLRPYVWQGQVVH